MDRKTQTTIARLQVGDRFYKPSDEKKEVWQYEGFNQRRFQCKRDKDLFCTPFISDTKVVFLRHKN